MHEKVHKLKYMYICINVYKTYRCGYLPHFILYIPSHTNYVCNPIYYNEDAEFAVVLASVFQGMYKMK